VPPSDSAHRGSFLKFRVYLNEGCFHGTSAVGYEAGHKSDNDDPDRAVDRDRQRKIEEHECQTNHHARCPKDDEGEEVREPTAP